MSDELVMVVVANKLDLKARREVTLEQAREYVTRVLGPDTLLYEASAKDDDGKFDNEMEIRERVGARVLTELSCV